jgi:hypothetical protein
MLNLESAMLMDANLCGADLRNTNLKWADLTRTRLDETTILPDGTTWTPQTDMGRFTDPDHSEFFQPDYADMGASAPKWWRTSNT